MDAVESTEDLLRKLTDKVRSQHLCDTDKKHTEANAAEAEASGALDAVLSRISKTPKEDLPEQARYQLDAALVDLDGENGALRRPLIHSLRRSKNYRAFLGLPCILERLRRYLTKTSLKKITDVFEGSEGLANDVKNGTRLDELQWVEPVLRKLAGERRLKRDLGGFELSSSAKGKVRALINITKKRVGELESEAAKKGKKGVRGCNSRTAAAHDVVMERDIRLVDQERRVAQSVGLEQMIDKALSARKK